MALVTHLAFELRTSTPDSLVAALAERVETSGYRSLWVNHPPNEDGLGQLAQMAAATTRITLGTAVVPISAVPPDAILRRIDETGLPPERLRLGIGSGWGAKPLDRMAERRRLPERTHARRDRGRRARSADARARRDAGRRGAAQLRHSRTGQGRGRGDQGAGQGGRPVPGVYVNVLAGVGAAQITELKGSAAFLSRLPAYAAHFSRSGIGPEQTWIAARQLGELPALLGPWRDTVDEVVLIPVSAEAAGSARDLVDAAIAAF